VGRGEEYEYVARYVKVNFVKDAFYFPGEEEEERKGVCVGVCVWGGGSGWNVFGTYKDHGLITRWCRCAVLSCGSFGLGSVSGMRVGSGSEMVMGMGMGMRSVLGRGWDNACVCVRTNACVHACAVS